MVHNYHYYYVKDIILGMFEAKNRPLWYIVFGNSCNGIIDQNGPEESVFSLMHP